MGIVILSGVSKGMTVPSGATPISNFAVGSTVKMNVNGTATEFLIVHQGKPSSIYDDNCDGTWLLMKDIYEIRQWDSSDSNSYWDSTIHNYLNGTFLNLFDADIQTQIKFLQIPSVVDAGNSAVASGANGLYAQIFLLSGYEVGCTQSSRDPSLPIDGAKLDYFVSDDDPTADANERRIAYLDGTATDWWLRSMLTGETGSAWIVTIDGDLHAHICEESFGIRPALVLPSTTRVDKNGMVVA